MNAFFNTTVFTGERRQEGRRPQGGENLNSLCVTVLFDKSSPASTGEEDIDPRKKGNASDLPRVSYVLQWRSARQYSPMSDGERGAGPKDRTP